MPFIEVKNCVYIALCQFWTICYVINIIHFAKTVAECRLCFDSSSRTKDLEVQIDTEIFSCATFFQSVIKFLAFGKADVRGLRLHIERYTEFQYERAEINVILTIQIKMYILWLQISRTNVTWVIYIKLCIWQTERKCSSKFTAKHFSEDIRPTLIDLFVALQFCFHLFIPGNHIRKRGDVSSKCLWNKREHITTVAYSGILIFSKYFAMSE
jgi:hypothetical protein